MSNTLNKRKTSLVFFIFVMLFFYLPLIILTIFSFNEGRGMVWTKFSLKWYKELFQYSDNIWVAFKYSIIISLISSLISTIIGTLGAIALKWFDFKGKNLLKNLSILPLVVPDIIIGVSLLIMFSTIKFKLGILTIFIAHTTFNIPYVLFILLSRLDEFDFSVVEAAYDLGASHKQTLMKVILPMLFPAIISAFLMALTLSFDDFIITFFVAGPGSSTLPLRIYSMIRRGVSPVINVLSVILLIISITLTLSTKKLQKNFLN